jgi:hypothetical protein
MSEPVQETVKVKYTRMVCLFLAESLRTRRIPLKRSVEIVEKILQHINLMDTESDYLALIKELSYDFQELTQLESIMVKNFNSDQRRQLETFAREFAIKILPTDSKTALAIMQDAVQDGITMAQLRSKYPEFGNYVNNHA